MVFWFTATTVVAYSILALLFKVAAPQVRSAHMVYAASVIPTILGLIYFLLFERTWHWGAAGLAFLAGITFYFATIARTKALVSSPTSLVFAITNLDLIVAGAVMLFLPNGNPTVLKFAAVVLAGVAVLIGAQVRGVESLNRYTYICLGLLVVSTLAAITYARNFGALLGVLMFVDFLAGVIPGVHRTRLVTRREWLWGALIGSITFGAFLLMIIAQSRATIEQLPLVLLMLNLKTPLTAMLAVPIFKEQLTVHKIVAVVLATVALFLW